MPEVRGVSTKFLGDGWESGAGGRGLSDFRSGPTGRTFCVGPSPRDVAFASLGSGLGYYRLLPTGERLVPGPRASPSLRLAPAWAPSKMWTWTSALLLCVVVSRRIIDDYYRCLPTGERIGLWLSSPYGRATGGGILETNSASWRALCAHGELASSRRRRERSE